jgi:hypothetical protein
MLFSMQRRILCRMWNGSFVNITRSINRDEIRFTHDISSFKLKDASTRESVPVIVVTLMKLERTGVQDRRLPPDSWG